MSRCVLHVACLLLVVAEMWLLHAQTGTAVSDWVAKEKGRLEEAKKAGASYAIITFSAYKLFWHSKSAETPSAETVQQYRLLLDTADVLGLAVIGTSTTWVLPPFGSPTLTPASGTASLGNERRLACVPGFESGEYARLSAVRNDMWSTLAEVFPEVKLWYVGYEPGMEFFECSGKQLALEDLFVYSVDTLRGINQAIKSESPDSTVIAHFLGRTGIPIYVSEEVVQPLTIAAGIEDEIRSRSGSAVAYYDMRADELEPSLLIERFPEEPTGFETGHRGHLDCEKTYCDPEETAPWTYSGWNIKCCEDFDTNVSNVWDSASYPEWERYLTNYNSWYTSPIAVLSDLAKMLVDEPTGGQTNVVSAAKTTDGTQVVPEDEFDSEGNSPGDERNRWVAVLDFEAVEKPNLASTHAAIMLRVNDRDWDDDDEDEDQTRFGTIAYRGPDTTYPCTGQGAEPGCGALQLTGDDASDPDDVADALLRFTLDEEPWENPTTLYRLQILEREWYHPLSFVWEPWWRSEVLSDGTPIGYKDWVGEWTVENVYGIAAPELSGSKILFALSENAEEDDEWPGAIDAELTGTAYWIY